MLGGPAAGSGLGCPQPQGKVLGRTRLLLSLDELLVLRFSRLLWLTSPQPGVLVAWKPAFRGWQATSRCGGSAEPTTARLVWKPKSPLGPRSLRMRIYLLIYIFAVTDIRFPTGEGTASVFRTCCSNVKYTSVSCCMEVRTIHLAWQFLSLCLASTCLEMMESGYIENEVFFSLLLLRENTFDRIKKWL